MHYTLGRAAEIEEGACKAYTLTINHKPLALLVVRHHDRFYAYENSCPHTGVTLNWQPDQFLDITSQHIQCATHGALFRIDDGLCEWGPCLGQRLRALTVEVQQGELRLINRNVAQG